MVVCDLKPDIDGRWQYVDFLMSNGLQRSPGTFMVETRNRGMHLCYRAPEDQALGNTAGRLAPGIDTRASGGYVVAPGISDCSREYPIYRGCPIASAPEALVEALTQGPTLTVVGSTRAPSSGYVEAAIASELERVSSAAVGTRNPTLNRAPFALGHPTSGDLRDDVMSQLVIAGIRSGLLPKRCIRTVQSGFSAGQLRPRETETAAAER